MLMHGGCPTLILLSAVSLKNLSLRLLLIVVTAVDNVSQNVLLEYVMMNSVFESIMQVMSGPEARDHHGYDAAVVLTVLSNYRKYEAANPYVIKLSVLDDEIALNGLACVISSVLSEYNRYKTWKVEMQNLKVHIIRSVCICACVITNVCC